METTREELYKLIWKEPVTKVAEKMGVPAPILRKYCHRLNIPTPSSGYWSKLQFGKPVEIPSLPAFEDKEVPTLDSFQKPKKKKVIKKAQKELAKEKEIPPYEESAGTPSNSDEPKQEAVCIMEEPQDPREKIQYELKKMDQVVFVVPEVLYAKNPLIIDTKEYYRDDSKAKYLYRNPYKSKIQSPLNIHVEPENLDRALRIFSTIIRVLELRGHQIVAKDINNTFVIVNEEEIPIQLYEKTKQIPNTETNYSKYLTVPSGRLKFVIPRKRLFHDTPIYIEDTPSIKMEERIINIIAKIEIVEEKREKERKLLKAAFISAECYSWANILRAYVEKYESFINKKETINDEDKEKLHWLKSKIKWLDPFIEYDDELLTEKDKQYLIYPESDIKQHRTSFISCSDIPQDFTFWNNPFRRRS